MSPSERQPAVRFGTFTFDPRAGELRKHDRKLKIQGQPLEILALLLERPGEMVTREELQKRLWPEDTFVDFEHSLNAAVKRLRDAMGDSADAPQYVETLARRGYRFIAPVEAHEGPASFAAGAIQRDPNADVCTDLQRVRHELESGKTAAPKPTEKSVAVLYFENLSGAKEDEYLRDGMTEDVITELTKIRTLRVFHRAAVAAFRDKVAMVPEVGRQISATHVLAGSLRRAGNRLRINVQMVETRTGHSVWAERYDREMKDVFEVQEDIARCIAQALRISLSPQEEQRIARKPTANLQAYDFFLRGRNYTRRQNREFALQMFEHALQLDPNFALAHAGIANVCGMQFYLQDRNPRWIERGIAAVNRALELDPELPEAFVAHARISYAQQKYDEAAEHARAAIARKSDCESSWDMLGRALFAADRWQEAAGLVERALEANGDDYNVYIAYRNALKALGWTEANRALLERTITVLEQQLEWVPEDTRARILLAGHYAETGRRAEAIRELQLVLTLGTTDPHTIYNAACTYAVLEMTEEALATLNRAAQAGFSEWDLAARDPDFARLRDEPEFKRVLERGKLRTCS